MSLLREQVAGLQELVINSFVQNPPPTTSASEPGSQSSGSSSPVPDNVALTSADPEDTISLSGAAPHRRTQREDSQAPGYPQ